jgi:hypothetical protein
MEVALVFENILFFRIRPELGTAIGQKFVGVEFHDHFPDQTGSNSDPCHSTTGIQVAQDACSGPGLPGFDSRSDSSYPA